MRWGLGAVVKVSNGDPKGRYGDPEHLHRLPTVDQADARWPVCLIMTTFVTANRVAAYTRNALAWATAHASLSEPTRFFVVRTSGARLPIKHRTGVHQLAYKQTRCAGKHGNRSGFWQERSWAQGEYCIGHGQSKGEAGAIEHVMNSVEALNCAFFVKVTGKYFTPDLPAALRRVPASCALLVQSSRSVHGQNSELFGGSPEVFRKIIHEVTTGNNAMETVLLRERERERGRGSNSCILPILSINWSITGEQLTAGNGELYLSL